MSEATPRLSLSARILIGLLSGVACGLFFGETVGWMEVVGEVFVGLLQMTVLPYVVVALTANIGRLTVDVVGYRERYLSFLKACIVPGIIIMVVGTLMVIYSAHFSFLTGL